MEILRNYLQSIKSLFFSEYQRWSLWYPVCIGIGVAGYYSLHYEPSVWFLAAAPSLLLGFFFKRLRVVIVPIFLLSLGFNAAQIRTISHKVPMLEQEIGPLWIKGTIESIEEKPSKSEHAIQRITISNLDGVWDDWLPEKVRITIRGYSPELKHGDNIKLKAVLLPLSGPAIPGGYDFKRQAFFQGIQATGYNLSPPKIRGAYNNGPLVFLENIRQSLTNSLRHGIEGQEGAIAAALVTGDKSGISDDTRDMFVKSGLAHILAISGLHMSIVAGMVFIIIRRGGATIPGLALRHNTKKIAAIGTILVTAFYLCISGFGVPAERSFIMVGIVMIAILLDRQAISLRTVAIAASIILLLTPEKLLSPSFQLSFAAVIALIAAYERWQNPVHLWLTRGGYIRWILAYFIGLMFTSFIATIATLPFTIMTFNRFTLVAVFANIVAVPLTVYAIMPLLLLFVIIYPIGIEPILYSPIKQVIGYLVEVASFSASIPGSDIKLSTPSSLSFTLVVMGALWLIIWSQRWRFLGIFPLMIGMILALKTVTPDVLVDSSGKLVGALTSDGQLLVSSKRRGKFQRELWMNALGVTDFETMECDRGHCRVKIKDQEITISTEENSTIENTSFMEINLNANRCSGNSKFCINQGDLKTHGSHAIYIDGEDIKLVPAMVGQRPWSANDASNK